MKFKKVIFVITLLIAGSYAGVTNSAPEIYPKTDDMFSINAFNKWWLSDINNQLNFRRFENYLKQNKVLGVVPSYQLIRTASDAGICNQAAFEVPPDKFWQNMVITLRFIKEYVNPELGNLEALSSYRNPGLNICAGGAKRSAHTQYFAVDLRPINPLPRKELFYKICRIHEKYGKTSDIGLGFYSGLRFHLDSKSFRRWGYNGAGKTSPCAEYDMNK